MVFHFIAKLYSWCFDHTLAHSHLQVKAALHVDLASVKKQLAKFKAMDKNGDGTLDVDEFERGLGFTQPSDVVRNLFSQLDVHDSGRIDFRQVRRSRRLIAVWMVVFLLFLAMTRSSVILPSKSLTFSRARAWCSSCLVSVCCRRRATQIRTQLLSSRSRCLT